MTDAHPLPATEHVPMSEDEFIDMHCAQNGVTRQELARRRVAVPCDCAAPGCPGWMMVPGPDALVGPRWTLPSGLTIEQMNQYITDCADGEIQPDAQPKGNP
jgi:hypothetical protein